MTLTQDHPVPLDLTGLMARDIMQIDGRYYDVIQLNVRDSAAGWGDDGRPRPLETVVRLSLARARRDNGDLRYGPRSRPPFDVVTIDVPAAQRSTIAINGCGFRLAMVSTTAAHSKVLGPLVPAEYMELELIRTALDDEETL